MLNGKFAMALAAAMVLATLYGCSSNGIKDSRDKARTAQMMAEEERDAANAAAAAALAAQMMAEEERDAANAAAAAAAAAQMTAEGERDAANTAQMMAEDAQAAAETAQAAAETAQMMAEDAQAAAETAQAAAETAQMMAEDAQAAAETAQGMAEGERDAANTAKMMADEAAAAAEVAKGMAEGERDAANTAKMMADEAAAAAEAAKGMAEGERDAANTAKMMADEAAAAAEAAKDMAEGERDAANTAKMMADEAAAAAEAAKDMAEGERDAANTAKMMADEAAAAAAQRATDADMAAAAAAQRATDADMAAAAAAQRATDAETAQGMAEAERDTAVTAKMTADEAAAAAAQRATDAETAQGMAEAERDTAVTAKMMADDAAAAAEQRATDAATAQATAEQERDDALAAQKTAQDALAAALVTVDYNNAYAQYTAARTAYTTALIAYNNKAANVMDATALVAAAETAQTEANEAMAAAADGEATEMATALAAVTAAGNAVAAARAELAEAQMTEAAMPFAGAIKDQNTEMDDGDHNGYATASHDGTDVKVTVTRGSAADNDVTDTIAMDVVAGGPRNGWYRAEAENEDDSGLTATVLTNVEDTMDKFSNVYNATSDAITGVNNGVLGLSNTELTLFNKYAMSSAFPGAGRGATTITYDTDDEDNPREFDGTYGGVNGEFKCTGDPCTIEANSDGMITVVSGTWTFVPDYLGPDGTSEDGVDEAQMATREDDLSEPNVRVDDTDYLRFGWWTAVDEEGAVKFRTFYGGQDPFTASNIDELEGKATYTGPAAGRYAVKTYNTNASINSIAEGMFTAKTMLEARFGGDTIAATDHDSIDGKVYEFKNEHGQDLHGWSILLTKIEDLQDLNTTGDAFMSDTVGGAVGGSPVSSGSWEGQFYGNGDPDDVNELPASIAGKFEAHSSHGHVGGAFGASR